uniref:Macro domain-containing protein n=3 Tax=Trichobilharzia regenti TaxID=157069 RepID=A0AA85J8R4_TRIRE|nr:unnamed protein product [Trichobilharzia regenti]
MLTTVIFPSSGSKMYLPLTDKKNRAYLKAAKLKDPPRHKVYGFGVPLVMSEKIISKTVIRVLNGDITKVHADAVVHPTSSRISFHGIIGSTLLSKGGSALENAVRSCIQNEGFPTYLEVRKTPAFNIGAQWILHCYSPTWRQNSNCIESDLSVAVMNCLKLCESERFCSVAFPSIGSGKAGVPKQLAAQTILQTLKNYVDARSGNTSLKVIYFVLYDRESIVVYTTELNRLI